MNGRGHLKKQTVVILSRSGWLLCLAFGVSWIRIHRKVSANRGKNRSWILFVQFHEYVRRRFVVRWVWKSVWMWKVWKIWRTTPWNKASTGQLITSLNWTPVNSPIMTKLKCFENSKRNISHKPWIRKATTFFRKTKLSHLPLLPEQTIELHWSLTTRIHLSN